MANFKHFHRKYKSPWQDEIQILNFDCNLYFLCFSDPSTLLSCSPHRNNQYESHLVTRQDRQQRLLPDFSSCLILSMECFKLNVNLSSNKQIPVSSRFLYLY